MSDKEDSSFDELAARAAAKELSSAGSPSPRSRRRPRRSPELQLQLPNPFERRQEDESMPTASPERNAGGLSHGKEEQERSAPQRVAAAPALPQPPRFADRIMQDRRVFMREYETYMIAINALQTQWNGAFAMPVGACIESRTKRMIARYEFNLPPNMISEQQWIDYFKQALSPSHIDYATVDKAMKKLRMETRWPEPESRMMNLQADMEAILDEFNLTDVAFAHEQRRLVKYLADALAPPSFKAVIATKLTLRENKNFKNEVVPFCSWVTKLMKEFMTWEHAAQAAAGHTSSSQQQGGRRGNNGGRGGEGARGANGGRGVSTGVSNSGRNNGAGSPPTRSGPGGGSAQGTASASVARASTGADTRTERGTCLKCQATGQQVRECPRCEPGEAAQLLRAMREQRNASRPASMRKFDVTLPGAELDDDQGTVAAAVDGVPSFSTLALTPHW
uniref:CCHC-type domain-containing protein n=1 Tax=Phytophthora ramorum TaxID=164328 RepID=H3GD33_PHYRM